MSQTSRNSILFRYLWRGLRYFLLGLLALVALYGVARLIDVSFGSIYEGSRGPYLQMPGPTAITVRWQSLGRHIGRLHFGRDKDKLTREVSEHTATKQHALRLTGLAPLSRYYYRVEDKNKALSQTYSFVTAAGTGSDAPLRFWITGDEGYRNPVQTAVKQTAWRWLRTHPRSGRGLIDFWLTTGDNAYPSGTNKQFQENFFLPYADVLARYAVWPTYGNHDARRSPFFNIFSPPTNAESGGTASHTKHYYSFDDGQLHVVMMDTEASSLAADGKMAQWLQTDLKATRQPWRIVVMHHPPYTKGGHNSDRRGDSGGRMFAVRENILPMLERLGVDMVISGHSHDYERSDSIACHYGESSSWKSSYIRDKTSPYSKGVGTVYMVIGSSSKLDHGPLNHPALPVSLEQSGSVIIDINQNTLTSRFINKQGVIADQFQIVKDKNSKPPGSRHCE